MELTQEEVEAREKIRLKVEQEQKKQDKILRDQKDKADRERQALFETTFSGGGDCEEIEAEETTDDSDSDWEDAPEQVGEKVDGSKSGYNTVQLKYFSMEADRYNISDRAAAKLGNALLKDYKIVTKGSTKKLLCPSKVKRERKRWGGKLEQELKGKPQSQGLYCDGKRVDTIVRDTVTTKIQVPGRKGKSAYREVSSSSNKIEKQEHFVVVSEPEGQYCTHVTPETGCGASIAKEVVAVVRERGVKLSVMGMDGCSVNCGIHNGVFRLLELDLGYPVQHCVCLLHLNELPLRHYFIQVDGTTSGPGMALSNLLIY